MTVRLEKRVPSRSTRRTVGYLTGIGLFAAVLLLSLQAAPVHAADDPADGRDIFTDGVAEGTVQLSTASSASAGSTGSSATLADQSGNNSSAFSNATYELEVELAGDPPGSQLSLTVHEQYLIQNHTTAQRAANDTITHEWHDSADRLEHAFDLQAETGTGLEYHGDPVVTLTSANTTAGSEVGDVGREVRVRHEAVLTNVPTRHEPPVEALHDEFGTDASLTVEAPGQAAHHNADDAFVDRGGQTLRWTGDADTERAELVFDDDAFETDRSAVGLLGTLLVWLPFVLFAVGAGLVIALVALLLIGSLRLLSVVVRMVLRLLVALGHYLFR
ncbi:hypothetical protein [Natrialba sp. SSL1]|uniref:hypothetical protein n=1 Tax=Natrialba sp. SSL1 TaxID=1869245 RepID=UPI0008F87DF5|nr:hypothetical protein [Natrialba sp. SSL1]OIB56710.1 hypothetical protein BBD46_17150 [Natrialba sp. SSL1]